MSWHVVGYRILGFNWQEKLIFFRRLTTGWPSRQDPTRFRDIEGWQRNSTTYLRWWQARRDHWCRGRDWTCMYIFNNWRLITIQFSSFRRVGQLFVMSNTFRTGNKRLNLGRFNRLNHFLRFQSIISRILDLVGDRPKILFSGLTVNIYTIF